MRDAAAPGPFDSHKQRGTWDVLGTPNNAVTTCKWGMWRAGYRAHLSQ
jgi:hypothetical protein